MVSREEVTRGNCGVRDWRTWAGLGQPLGLRFWGLTVRESSAQRQGMYEIGHDEKGSLGGACLSFCSADSVLWHCPFLATQGPSQPLQELMFRPPRAGHAGGGARGTGVRPEEGSGPREGAGRRAGIQSGQLAPVTLLGKEPRTRYLGPGTTLPRGAGAPAPSCGLQHPSSRP